MSRTQTSKKSYLLVLSLFVVIGALLAGCGSNNKEKGGASPSASAPSSSAAPSESASPSESPSPSESAPAEVTLKIGAAAVPHAVILDFVKPKLKEQGVNLDVVVFDDEGQLNPALKDGQIDGTTSSTFLTSTRSRGRRGSTSP